jgi:hypothetical protein
MFVVYREYYMNFETALWKRSQRSYGTTVPHLALLNLDVKNKKYKVIWEFNERVVSGLFHLKQLEVFIERGNLILRRR